MRPFALVVVSIAFAAGLAAPVHGQELVDPVRGERAFQRILNGRAEALPARITPIRPSFTLSFRFQTGYTIEAPLEPLEGSRHYWAVLIRVTPEDGGASYLRTMYNLPATAAPKDRFRKFGGQKTVAGGMFFIGEGKYTVELLVRDDRGRIAHHRWSVHAERKGAEKKVQPLMAEGEVGSFGSMRWSPAADSGERALRLTMLVHAAPGVWRSEVMRPRDVARLLGQMTAILEQVPVKSLRVVAFSLDQQTEIYRQEEFAPESFEKLRVAIAPVQLGKVDISVLTNKRGHLDLVADLVNGELHAEKPSDAVVFIGPLSPTVDKLKSGMIDAPAADSPEFLYYQYNSIAHAQSAHLPDTIESAVKKVGGRVYKITTAGDFAKAIEALRRQTVRKPSVTGELSARPSALAGNQ